VNGKVYKILILPIQFRRAKKKVDETWLFSICTSTMKNFDVHTRDAKKPLKNPQS
jgi:hypothetical protein